MVDMHGKHHLQTVVHSLLINYIMGMSSLADYSYIGTCSLLCGQKIAAYKYRMILLPGFCFVA